MKAKRILCLFCAVILAALCFSGCAAQKTEKAFVEAKDFNDAKIGVLTGSNFEGQTQKKFPDSEKLRFDTLPVSHFPLCLKTRDHSWILLDAVS